MRFSGFDDEWNEVTLNDVATFSKGKGISKNDISNYGIECVRYGELYTKYNEMIYNIESKTDLDKNELKLSEKNDILIPCSGETAIDLATASCIQKDQVAIGGDITVIKTNQYAPFITYYLNQKKTEIAKYAQGVSIVHLYPKDFKVMNIRIPSINEQKMIIRLLEEITKKEQLLESKYQQYQEFKKYLMQQIFTQKLRFNFDDEWKQYKLKDVLTVKSSSISINQLEENTGDYPLYGASGFLKNIDFCEMDVDYISIVKDGSGVGNLSFHEKNSSIVNTSQYLLPKKNFNINFLYYLLQTINLMKYVNGSSIPHIYFKDYCIEKINIPSLDEQEKIGKLFVDVDITMENLNKNINATQEFKKGLLQQMFVVRINWRCNFKLAKSPSFNKHLLILKNKIIFIIIK